MSSLIWSLKRNREEEYTDKVDEPEEDFDIECDKDNIDFVC